MGIHVISGEVLKTERVSVSGGVRPVKFTLLVKGLKGITHSLLGSLIGEQGLIVLTFDKNIAYNVSDSLAKKVNPQFVSRQRMAKNLWVTDLNFEELKGKKMEIVIHY